MSQMSKGVDGIFANLNANFMSQLFFLRRSTR